MKKLFTIALVLVGSAVFAQSTQVTSATSVSVQTTTLTPKAKALCKTWNLTMTENFGDQHKPTDVQKNDLLLLQEGGRYRLIMNGVAEGGTWTLSKDNLWITLTTDAGAIKKFKVVESTETSLKIDYKDSDDVHNILMYAVTK